jgi:hypothetical protein
MSVVILNDTSYYTVQVGVYDNAASTFTAKSEIQTVDVDRQCSFQEYYFTWLNRLASWEYFNFKGESSEGLEYTQSDIATKNTFQNWDVDFRNGETTRFYSKIQAFTSRIIRSQLLTKQQIQGLINMLVSIQVQQFVSDTQKKTVLVQHESEEQIYRDREFFKQLTISIQESEEKPIQSQ